MEIKNLIEKVKKNSLQLTEYANSARSILSRKYKTEYHPDRRSLIIYNIDIVKLRKICKEYRCSGMMLEDNKAIVSNFGYYE